MRPVHGDQRAGVSVAASVTQTHGLRAGNEAAGWVAPASHTPREGQEDEMRISGLGEVTGRYVVATDTPDGGRSTFSECWGSRG